MGIKSHYSMAALWTTTAHIGLVSSMLLRNIIFARFLSQTDFALALTFGVVLSLFEYISNFGHENFMQRSLRGNQKSFQSTMQLMMVLRGSLIALLIVCIAPYIPKLLNIQGLEFNYALLAIVPFINGFAHLDPQRFQRRQIYTISAKVSLISDALSILIALLCISIWDSYWAFYVSFVFRHSISTLLSHLFAKRPYELMLEKDHALALMNFGIPLLLVGLLKYIGTEFDKAVIANVTGLKTFSVYVLTLMVMLNGVNIVVVSLSKIFIRRLSLAGDSLDKAHLANGIVYCYLTLPIILALCIFGESIIALIFGQQYASVHFLIFAAAALVGVRFINQWLNQAVIAAAPTTLMLKSDVVRVTVTLIGLGMVFRDASVFDVILIFWIAELSYFFTLSYQLNKRFSAVGSSSIILAIYLVFTLTIWWGYTISHDGSFALKLQFA
nr:oligosaccharide flippase family protein [Acidiferrobacterales bacterium]